MGETRQIRRLNDGATCQGRGDRALCECREHCCCNCSERLSAICRSRRGGTVLVGVSGGILMGQEEF